MLSMAFKEWWVDDDELPDALYFIDGVEVPYEQFMAAADELDPARRLSG